MYGKILRNNYVCCESLKRREQICWRIGLRYSIFLSEQIGVKKSI